MKIGIIADTHDNLNNIDKAIGVLRREKVSYLFHAGDYIAPFSIKPLSSLSIPIIGVFGNNDGEVFGLRDLGIVDLHYPPRTYILEGRNLLLLHDPYLLDTIMNSDRFDFIFFGHTHSPEVKRNKGCVAINPGECCGWVNGRATIAILELKTGEVNIIDLQAE